MAQAAGKDTETSLREEMESVGVTLREENKAERLSQEQNETENDKTDETNETMEDTQKEGEEDNGKDATDEGAQKKGVKGDREVEAREGEEQTGDENWEIPYSDEEVEDPKSWMPPPQEIKRLYELLAKGEVLELSWVPLPRRPPTPPRTPSPERGGEESHEPKEEENQNRSQTPTEFDFNEEQMTPKNTFINRRMTPGSSARYTVSSKARMDKVLFDLRRHRQMDEQLLRSGQDLFKSDKPHPAPAPKKSLSPNSQREREKERERDSDPSTVFSPRQRRY